MNIPKHLFSLPLELGSERLSKKIPRRLAEAFDIVPARLGSVNGEFLLAVANARPTVSSSRAVVRAVAQVDRRHVAIFSPDIDSGMMKALTLEGIAYVRDEDNAFLPFLGMVISPTRASRVADILSPHAQRMVLNVISGAWDGCSAGELAEAASVSRATVSGCLAQIEAVLPSMVATEWRSRTLRNPGLAKEDLLDIFEPYLTSPVKGRKLLRGRGGLGALQEFRALLSGESALSFYSDLAHGGKPVRVAVHRKKMNALTTVMGEHWVEAAWFEEPGIIIEEWAYEIDGRNSVSKGSTGFDSLDALSLYMEMKDAGKEDVRMADAINQLREEACR